MVSINLEKEYDKILSALVWRFFYRRSVLRGSIDKDLYEGVTTSVRTACGEADEFPLTIGLHHRSTLSAFLFALILDELTAPV